MKNSLKPITYNPKPNRGFTLLIAIVTTSMLLVVSFVVVNIALKQLVLANAARESQYAFYAADSGTECAVYWDLKGGTTGDISAFSTTTPGVITCNGQAPIGGGNLPWTNYIPARQSLIGGGGDTENSIFQLNFTKGCAFVEVRKIYGGGELVTTVDSRGYNTCDINASRRYERGVTLSY